MLHHLWPKLGILLNNSYQYSHIFDDFQPHKLSSAGLLEFWCKTRLFQSNSAGQEQTSRPALQFLKGMEGIMWMASSLKVQHNTVFYIR